MTLEEELKIFKNYQITKMKSKQFYKYWFIREEFRKTYIREMNLFLENFLKKVQKIDEIDELFHILEILLDKHLEGQGGRTIFFICVKQNIQTVLIHSNNTNFCDYFKSKSKIFFRKYNLSLKYKIIY